MCVEREVEPRPSLLLITNERLAGCISRAACPPSSGFWALLLYALLCTSPSGSHLVVAVLGHVVVSNRLVRCTFGKGIYFARVSLESPFNLSSAFPHSCHVTTW